MHGARTRRRGIRLRVYILMCMSVSCKSEIEKNRVQSVCLHGKEKKIRDTTCDIYCQHV